MPPIQQITAAAHNQYHANNSWQAQRLTNLQYVLDGFCKNDKPWVNHSVITYPLSQSIGKLLFPPFPAFCDKSLAQLPLLLYFLLYESCYDFTTREHLSVKVCVLKKLKSGLFSQFSKEVLLTAE